MCYKDVKRNQIMSSVLELPVQSEGAEYPNSLFPIYVRTFGAVNI